MTLLHIRSDLRWRCSSLARDLRRDHTGGLRAADVVRSVNRRQYNRAIRRKLRRRMRGRSSRDLALASEAAVDGLVCRAAAASADMVARSQAGREKVARRGEGLACDANTGLTRHTLPSGYIGEASEGAI